MFKSVTYLSWAVGKSSTVDREYEGRFFGGGSGDLRKSFDGRDGVCGIWLQLTDFYILELWKVMLLIASLGPEDWMLEMLRWLYE